GYEPATNQGRARDMLYYTAWRPSVSTQPAERSPPPRLPGWSGGSSPEDDGCVSRPHPACRGGAGLMRTFAPPRQAGWGRTTAERRRYQCFSNGGRALTATQSPCPPGQRAQVFSRND